jgi:hypothetical protein
MTLVDTSSWILMLRADGDQTVRRRVEVCFRQAPLAGVPWFVWSSGMGPAANVIIQLEHSDSDFDRLSSSS